MGGAAASGNLLQQLLLLLPYFAFIPGFVSVPLCFLPPPTPQRFTTVECSLKQQQLPFYLASLILVLPLLFATGSEGIVYTRDRLIASSQPVFCLEPGRKSLRSEEDHVGDAELGLS